MKIKKFHTKYPFRRICCYIPGRYENLQLWQKAQQDTVWKFKNGIVSEKIKKKFLDAINRISADDPADYIITFVPTFHEEYPIRWKELSGYLTANSSIPVAYCGVTICKKIGYPKHSGGDIPTVTPENILVKESCFKDKKVILIDDVITTGRTFKTVGDELMKAGAKAVKGVVLAMTIHPNLPTIINKKKKT